MAPCSAAIGRSASRRSSSGSSCSSRSTGQVLSRGQLIEQVWGYDAEFYDEKSVNVYIRRLREKIEREPSDPRILLTVTGMGYRLAT